jgi:hypothetical protein
LISNSFPSQLNLRISGSVKIGDGKEFEINALPVLP